MYTVCTIQVQAQVTTVKECVFVHMLPTRRLLIITVSVVVMMGCLWTVISMFTVLFSFVPSPVGRLPVVW